MNRGLLSVVVPSYNEEENIIRVAFAIKSVLERNNIPFELLFVDDGSKDKTWDNINSVSEAESFVRGIRFSRNFGKESAIMAGLTAATGDCCVVIDCDMQHPPEKIIEMYKLWEQGYDIVEGQKNNRGEESKLHTFATKSFYTIISAVTRCNVANTSDFKLLDKKAVNVLINMKESNGFFRALSSWIGFNSVSIKFDVQERQGGTSKWSTLALAKYAVNNITSFSAVPMQIVTVLGVIMLAISIIFGGITLIQKVYGQALEGFTTVILIQLFSSSILMISLGVIGYYIARIFEEVKGRPRYIIADTCGEKVNETTGVSKV
ncbi:MAG: glycosyltransferase family 2 protein [Clostridiaceae bacterium]|nr:glycosyltransferase family 2 protein [Clostridiaceae bacterium]